MKTCFKCNQKIDYVNEFDQGWKHFRMYVGEDGEIQYDEVDFSVEGNIEIACPKCHQTLFTNEEEAQKWLLS
jgi:hypothetical protein